MPVGLGEKNELECKYWSESERVSLSQKSESHHRRVCSANEIKPEKAVAKCKCL